MKKIFLVLLAIAILSTPFIVWSLIDYTKVEPEMQQPLVESSTEPFLKTQTSPIPPTKPSTAFMNGYWDGWHGKWLGPIRWAFSDEYRQGHMLGAHDQKNGISRYPQK